MTKGTLISNSQGVFRKEYESRVKFVTKHLLCELIYKIKKKLQIVEIKVNFVV